MRKNKILKSGANDRYYAMITDMGLKQKAFKLSAMMKKHRVSRSVSGVLSEMQLIKKVGKRYIWVGEYNNPNLATKILNAVSKKTNIKREHEKVNGIAIQMPSDSTNLKIEQAIAILKSTGRFKVIEIVTSERER